METPFANVIHARHYNQAYRMKFERNKQQKPFKPINEYQLLLFLSDLKFRAASIGKVIFVSGFDEYSGT